jgi:two-component system response regulator HydG
MPERESLSATLLVADDDPAVRESLERALAREGYAVVVAPDGQAALERLQQGGVDLVLSDLKMPGLTGLELLREAKAVAPDVDVIMLTAFGTVEEAVKAMKDGATDFLTKPFQRAQLIKVVRHALERRALIAQNRALQQRLDDLLRQGNIIGVSPAFRRMMTLVKQIANSSATVLIQGESGTGKELVARAVHEGSSRRGGPFVAVNCAALPETLLESELFGYEKGAFTGAAGRKEGRFELADSGTLFLDEVADLSPVTQPKILRVLQEGEFERVGGTKTIRVDVRIVTATNQDLAALVRDKRFREDLFYRLNVITINVPPLRERREDIPVLAQHFLRIYAAKNNRRLEGLSDEALECLEAHGWPGNVRELENVIERAVVLAHGSRVDLADLPEAITDRPVALIRASGGEGPAGADVAGGGAPALDEGVFRIRAGTPLAVVEQRLIEETLRLTGGNQKAAAKLLGVDPKTIYRKLKQTEAEETAPPDSGSDRPAAD